MQKMLIKKAPILITLLLAATYLCCGIILFSQGIGRENNTKVRSEAGEKRTDKFNAHFGYLTPEDILYIDVVGEPDAVPFKHKSEHYTIIIPLKDTLDSLKAEQDTVILSRDVICSGDKLTKLLKNTEVVWNKNHGHYKDLMILCVRRIDEYHYTNPDEISRKLLTDRAHGSYKYLLFWKHDSYPITFT